MGKTSLFHWIGWMNWRFRFFWLNKLIFSGLILAALRHFDAGSCSSDISKCFYLFVIYWGGGGHVKWADEVVGRFAHLRDNGNTHVGHVGNDVTVLRWDVSMLQELTQVLLSHTWHTQWGTQMHAVQIPGPNMQFTRMGTCMFRKKKNELTKENKSKPENTRMKNLTVAIGHCLRIKLKDW